MIALSSSDYSVTYSKYTCTGSVPDLLGFLLAKPHLLEARCKDDPANQPEKTGNNAKTNDELN